MKLGTITRFINILSIKPELFQFDTCLRLQLSSKDNNGSVPDESVDLKMEEVKHYI